MEVGMKGNSGSWKFPVRKGKGEKKRESVQTKTHDGDLVDLVDLVFGAFPFAPSSSLNSPRFLLGFLDSSYSQLSLSASLSTPPGLLFYSSPYCLFPPPPPLPLRLKTLAAGRCDCTTIRPPWPTPKSLPS